MMRKTTDNSKVTISNLVGCTFPEFIRYIIRFPGNLNEHWRTINSSCLPCSLKYNFILKLESFQRDFNDLIAELGLDMTVKTSEPAETTADLSLLYFRQLTPTDIRGVYQVYKEDFKMFGYTADEYFKL